MSTPNNPAEPVPVFRISLANGLLVSALYLALALFTELAGRVWNPRWLEPLVRNLEAFPARVLHLFGLLEPLREAYLDDKVSGFTLRLIYGGTTVLVMMLIGMCIGVVMWLFQRSLTTGTPAE